MSAFSGLGNSKAQAHSHLGHSKRRPSQRAEDDAFSVLRSPWHDLISLLHKTLLWAILLDAAQSRSNVMGRPPRQAGSRSISRPSDRSTEPASGLGPFGSRSLRQEHGSVRFARFHNANNQDWSRCPAACCTVAAASTYIRSSASGSYQNPAYSWQLGSKMDGTHLSYG